MFHRPLAIPHWLRVNRPASARVESGMEGLRANELLSRIAGSVSWDQSCHIRSMSEPEDGEGS